ncbi:MAG: hypothetical protein AB3N13_08305, partial [Arenibacterium sp.]
MTANRRISNLAVAFNGGEASVVALRGAIAVARDFGAHLTGILAHGASSTSRNIPKWMSVDLQQSILSTLEIRAEEIRSKFHAIADALMPADKLHWLEIGGDPDTTISDYSQMYDLTILGEYESLVSADELELHPNKVVSSSGRPVLMVPKRNNGVQTGGTIVIAWDGNRAVTGAVANAMPLLVGAGRVVVLTVENGRTGTPLPGIDVKVMLERHGIEADWVRQAPKQDALANDVKTFCQHNHADLLVMGASSKSRISGHAAGNSINTYLRDSEIPIFI